MTLLEFYYRSACFLEVADRPNAEIDRFSWSRGILNVSTTLFFGTWGALVYHCPGFAILEQIEQGEYETR